MTPQISFAEIEKHNKEDSVWVVIHNEVYDVTSFLQEHPGGPDFILEVAGQDGTQGFEDAGHSDDARDLLKKYKIGVLPPGEQKVTSAPSNERPKSRSESSSVCSKSSNRPVNRSPCNTCEPKVERRVPAVIVPIERRPRGRPCNEEEGSNKYKYIIALAGAILIGFALKKYLQK